MFQGVSVSWSPIPELVRLDGDLTVIYLSGAGVRFTQLMDDDWYRATIPSEAIYALEKSGQRPTWRPDVSASPMGCLEQFQWCNSAYSRDRGCGPLASFSDSIYGAAQSFNVTMEDLAAERPLSSHAASARFIWHLLARQASPMNLGSLLGALGTKSLASQSKFFSSIQFRLPQDQWQLDVIQWWQVILAATQASR